MTRIAGTSGVGHSGRVEPINPAAAVFNGDKGKAGPERTGKKGDEPAAKQTAPQGKSATEPAEAQTGHELLVKRGVIEPDEPSV